MVPSGQRNAHGGLSGPGGRTCCGWLRGRPRHAGVVVVVATPDEREGPGASPVLPSSRAASEPLASPYHTRQGKKRSRTPWPYDDEHTCRLCGAFIVESAGGGRIHCSECMDDPNPTEGSIGGRSGAVDDPRGVVRGAVVLVNADFVEFCDHGERRGACPRAASCLTWIPPRLHSRVWPVMLSARSRLTRKQTLLACSHAYMVEFGSMVGGMAEARVGFAHHPPAIYAALVGRTSNSRKGTAQTEVDGVVDRVEEGWQGRHRVGGFGSGEAFLEHAAENPGDAVLMVESEFSRLLAVASREGSSVSSVLRSAWDFHRLEYRVRRQRYEAPPAPVSLLAHITAEELKDGRHGLRLNEVMNGFGNRVSVGLRRSALDPAEPRAVPRPCSRPWSPTPGLRSNSRGRSASCRVHRRPTTAGRISIANSRRMTPAASSARSRREGRRSYCDSH